MYFLLEKIEFGTDIVNFSVVLIKSYPKLLQHVGY